MINPNSPLPQEAERDRRQSRAERRRRYWHTLWHGLHFRRRLDIRRDADPRHNILIDHHETHFFGVIIATVLLCVVDAFLTLTILSQGGTELNPLMRELLQIDVIVFFAAKYVLTAFCLILALTHKRFRAFRYISGTHILWWALVTYAVLVAYELYLLNFIGG